VRSAERTGSGHSGPGQALLVLEDGRAFVGQAFGAVGETFGEAVFTTAMTGYQEALTDPSYYRQILVQTAPHIGNTGWNDEDNESSRVWAAGYVVRDPAPRPSSWRSRGSLDDELRRQNIVGIAGLDTRALTRHLRERGAMRAGVSSVDLDPASLLAKVQASPTMAGSHLLADVTTRAPYTVAPVGPKRFTVVAYDFGLKAMTPKLMSQRGLEVVVVPASTPFAELAARRPDGVFFSNGPGDPATADAEVALLRQVLQAGIPFFGICFGNQLFGRALGFGTYKLKYGHRGANQPIKDLAADTVEITPHNHGFAVDAPLDRAVATPFGTALVSHVNLNDHVVEGLELRLADGRLAGFSVQYHPEAAAGPHDAVDLFDRFVALMASPPPRPASASETEGGQS